MGEYRFRYEKIRVTRLPSKDSGEPPSETLHHTFWLVGGTGTPDPVVAWCEEHATGAWRDAADMFGYSVHFDLDDDAFAFRLRWC